MLLVVLLTLAQGLVGVTVVLEGSRTSYAQFRQWRGGANSTLRLEFSTHRADALLLYTDNRQTGEYAQLSLVGGAVRLRFNWGGGRAGMIEAGKDLNLLKRKSKNDDDHEASEDENWHSVVLLNSASETTLLVDRAFRARATFVRARANRKRPPKAEPRLEHPNHFANHSSNSYVYVGGLPSWYETRLSSLALPTVTLEPRLKGSVRKLAYRDVLGKAEVEQEMMAYKVSVLSFLLSLAMHCNARHVLR